MRLYQQYVLRRTLLADGRLGGAAQHAVVAVPVHLRIALVERVARPLVLEEEVAHRRAAILVHVPIDDHRTLAIGRRCQAGSVTFASSCSLLPRISAFGSDSSVGGTHGRRRLFGSPGVAAYVARLCFLAAAAFAVVFAAAAKKAT